MSRFLQGRGKHLWPWARAGAEGKDAGWTAGPVDGAGGSPEEEEGALCNRGEAKTKSCIINNSVFPISNKRKDDGDGEQWTWNCTSVHSILIWRRGQLIVWNVEDFACRGNTNYHLLSLSLQFPSALLSVCSLFWFNSLQLNRHVSVLHENTVKLQYTRPVKHQTLPKCFGCVEDVEWTCESRSVYIYFHV